MSVSRVLTAVGEALLGIGGAGLGAGVALMADGKNKADTAWWIGAFILAIGVALRLMAEQRRDKQLRADQTELLARICDTNTKIGGYKVETELIVQYHDRILSTLELMAGGRR